MIIVLKSGTSEQDVAAVCRRIEAMGYQAHTIRGEVRTVIGAVGDTRSVVERAVVDAGQTVGFTANVTILCTD